MLYRIGNKYYIRVQGYYKEVTIKVKGDNLEITPNGNEIEVTKVSNAEMINAQTEKDSIIKSLKTSAEFKPAEEKPIKKYRNYDKRM